MSSPAELRKQLRSRRRALTALQRQTRAGQLCAHLVQSSLYKTSRRIAVYLAVDAEVDVTALVQRAWRDGKRVYLPVLAGTHHNRLLFAPYKRGQRLVRNRFGIPEPKISPVRCARGMQFDLVIVPLVGFDAHGNRLGMGGGYYDRTFSFRLSRTRWTKPILAGVAFETQRVDALPRNAWDVPLDAVATEAGLTLF